MRKLHKDGGGGGSDVARRARATRAPKAKSCATFCDTFSAAFCAASFTCSSFTCRPRAAWGAACVCWACLKNEREKEQLPFLGATRAHTHTHHTHTQIVGYRKFPPLYAHTVCPILTFFEVTPPGAAPGPPVKTGARVRCFRGCNKACRTAQALRGTFPQDSSR